MAARRHGIFDPREWMAEGDGLLASAKLIRSAWRRRRRTFSRSIEVAKPRKDLWNALLGMPRASMLLMAYSAEMFLKAGLCKLYRNCSDDLIRIDQKRFGHKLQKIANELEIDLTLSERDLLEMLEHLITDSRYPLDVTEADHLDAKNAQTRSVWDGAQFVECQRLMSKLRKLISRIDSDRKKPASLGRIDLNSDDYISFRVGGHLPPRITYRRNDTAFSIVDLERLIFSDCSLAVPQFYWTYFHIYRDSGKKGAILIRLPLT